MSGRDELDSQSIGDFLGQLAARMPAPGAGATAAVEAALSASLVAMVGRFTKDEAHADVVREIVAAADAQRDACLEAAADDEAAFSAVAAAMKMPRGTPEEKETRRRCLAEVSLDATRPPLAVLTAAARAAATTARLAVEANLPVIDDDATRAHLVSAVAAVEDVARLSDEIEAEVRRRMHR